MTERPALGNTPAAPFFARFCPGSLPNRRNGERSTHRN
jgi:hypothetical protein